MVPATTDMTSPGTLTANLSATVAYELSRKHHFSPVQFHNDLLSAVAQFSSGEYLFYNCGTYRETTGESAGLYEQLDKKNRGSEEGG